jgi:ligand-binding sensor domain-containing protein/AraC-like DNA-binding protein
MKFLLSLLALLLSSIGLFGQKQDMVSFTIDDGMQNGSVQSMVKGSDGYVYIGTFTGITRYDGKNAVNIPISEHDDGKYNIVYDIVEASNHLFYVASMQGLWLFDASTLGVKRMFKESIDAKVVAVKQAGNDFVVATSHGLFLINSKGKLNVLTLYKSKKYTDFNVLDLDIELTTNGYVAWALTANGLVDINLKDGHGGDFHPFGSLLLPQNIAVTKNGNIAIGTNGVGLWMYSPRENRLWQSSFAVQGVNDIRVAQNGNLLLATEKNGGVEVNPNTGMIVKSYSDYASDGSTKVRFPSSQVFYRDEMGIDWIGYKFYGLDHTVYNSGVFVPYAMPDGTDFSNLHPACCLADEGKLFVGTRNGLFLIDEISGVVRKYGEQWLGGSFVSAVCKVGDSKYLVCVDGGGIKLFDSKQLVFSDIPLPQMLRSMHVFQVKNDKMGHFWFCTTRGLIRLDLQTIQAKVFDTKNSQLPNNEVYAIDFDFGGRGWISTRGGNCMYLPTIEAISAENIPHKIAEIGALRDIQRLDDGRMLFLPQRGFPIISDANVVKMSIMKFDVGEDSPNISFFLYRKGMCNFSTDKGFWVSKNGNLQCYSYADGLLSMEFQRCCNYDAKGRCFVVTNKGIAVSTISKLADISNRRSIPIVLTQIQTDRWLSDAKVAAAVANREIRLERSIEGFSIQFQALTYLADTRMQYMYKLEGYDDDWILANSHNTASYRTIPWGTYKLKIKVLGNDAIFGEYTIDVPMAYSTMALMFVVILLISVSFHVAWCRYYKKDYIWRRFIPKTEPQKYQSSKIAKSDADKVVKQLIKYVEQQKPYLNPDITMTDLAKAIGVSNHTLSQIFTQYMHRNYYDFIAEYRIKEFKMLANIPEYSKFTIMAIAEKCGFKSRTSFFAAFKNHTGCTPKEYMENNSNQR